MARPPNPTSGSRTAVGRGDLLRLLALFDEGGQEFAARLTGHLWLPPVEQLPLPLTPPLPPPKPEAPVAIPAPANKPALRAEHYHASVSRRAGLSGEFTERLNLAANLAGNLNQPMEVALPPLPETGPPLAIALSPRRRLVVFAEKTLRSLQSGNQWDISKLVRQLGHGLPPNPRRARKQRLRWRGNALVMHMSPQSEPLHDDYRALASLVVKRSGGRVPVYAYYPDMGWSQFVPNQRHGWRGLPQPPQLDGGKGLALGWPSGGAVWQPAWQPGAVLLAAADDAAPRRLPAMAHWDAGSSLQLRRRIPSGALPLGGSQIDPLLALLSLAVVVHPPLLRALRCLLGLPAVAELQVWNSPEVACNGIAIALRVKRRSEYLQQLSALPLALRQQASACIAAHHACLSLVIALEEAQLAHAHVPGAPVVRPEAYFRQMALQLRSGENTAELSAWLARAGHRLDHAAWLHAPEFALAWGLANPQVLHQPEQLPLHFPLQLLASLKQHVLPDSSSPAGHGVRLRQQDDALVIEACSIRDLSAATLQQNVLAQWPGSGVLQWRSISSNHWHRLTPSQAMEPIELAQFAPLEVIDGEYHCLIEHVARPSWALEWARDSQGLYALAPNPFGSPLRVDYPLPVENSAELLRQTEIIPGSESFYCDLRTIDLDAIGLIASVRINGTETQAFRYIAPGRFVMGSPLNEAGRDGDEGPQHWVEITEGFWLADTACTQGWWKTVMAHNPSHFNQSRGGSDSHPVEQVSWDQVQGFLARLQTIMPTCRATLSTEAEWEYACRAGSTTPFSFGSNISTDQVNFDGREPYNGAFAGQYRESTVAVKALPANGWGFYQMHGNVWEWCADTWRDYTTEGVRDPGLAHALNPLLDVGIYPVQQETARLLRGGGWGNYGQGARSAYRYLVQPDWRYFNSGFRFVLRSSIQSGKGF